MSLKTDYAPNDELLAADVNAANEQVNANEAAIAALEGGVKLEGTTADATPTELESGVAIDADSVSVFDIQVVAGNNVSAKGWNFKGTIRRDGAGNTSLGGAVKKSSFGEDDAFAAYDVNVTADDVAETLVVTVTGAGKWKASISLDKITF